MSGREIVRIRAATPNDASAISTLIRALAVRYIAQEFPADAANRLLGSMEESAIQGYMASAYRYHVAEERHQLAGVVAVRDNRHLYHLFVSEHFQGRGLARALWEVAKAASLDAGNSGVFTVNSSRYAVGMYEKFGFVRQAEVVDAAGVICIPMKLELT